MKLNIFNLDGLYLTKEVDYVVVDTANGQITILKDHLPLISSIKISHLIIGIDDNREYYAIAGGTLFVTTTETKIITPAIEKFEDIDIDRAEKAKQRAMERIESKDPNIDIKRANIALLKAINRISTRQ